MTMEACVEGVVVVVARWLQIAAIVWLTLFYGRSTVLCCRGWSVTFFIGSPGW